MDIAIALCLFAAQDKGELTMLKNIDEVEEAHSVANEIVRRDLLCAPRIALEVTCEISILSNGDHIEVRIVVRNSSRLHLVSCAHQICVGDHYVSHGKSCRESFERLL